MIVRRNKMYASPAADPTKEKTVGPRAWQEHITTNTTAGIYKPVNLDDSSNISIGDAMLEGRSINRTGNALQKTMSDTPMGVGYVGRTQVTPTPTPAPQKKSTWLSRVLRRNTNSITKGANSALDALPMSEESKAKQRRKISALKFWVNKGSKGIDKAAEALYSDNERMPVSAADMRKAETDGVVQRRPDGKWGIIAKRKRLWWSAGYDSRETAEAALRAYHAGRH